MEEIKPAPEPETNSGPSTPSVAGDLRLHEFPSRIFRNTRFLRIWLPPDYQAEENKDRHYPVLYLNDGQNLFESSTSFTGVEWSVDETADRLIREGTTLPVIIVGIDNAGNDRIKEYLPYRSLNPTILRPLGKYFPEFLIYEAMPFICTQYRIARGPENTGLGGSSLGALISLYTVMHRPGIFGKLLLESASLFTSNRRLLKEARNFRSWPDKIFMAIGTKEAGRDDKDRQVVQDLRDLERTLRTAGLNKDRLLVNIEEGATHSEAAWAKRFPQALTFLFGTGAGDLTT